MKLHAMRQVILVAISGFLVANVVLAWPDLFFFSKVVFLPEWAQGLPDPIIASWGVAAIAMLPLWLGPGRLSDVAYRFVAATSIGALAATLAWSASRGGMGWSNSVFQLVWVWGLHLLPPALLMAALRWTLHALVATRTAPGDAAR